MQVHATRAQSGWNTKANLNTVEMNGGPIVHIKNWNKLKLCIFYGEIIVDVNTRTTSDLISGINVDLKGDSGAYLRPGLNAY